MKRYLGLFLFLSGCTLSLSHEERVEHLISAPSLTPSENPGNWPDREWWKLFGSHELDCLIVTALANNPSIQAIEARITFARQEAVVAGAKLYPLVFFDANDQWSYLSQNGLDRALNPKIPLNNQQIDFSLSFSYEFDFWGKYRNLYHAALGRARAAEAEAAQVELITSTALAQAYFALKTNLLRQQLYKQLYEERKKAFALWELLVSNSLSSELPPLLSEERLFEAEQWLYAIEEEVAIDKHLVNILAGNGPDDRLSLEPTLAKLPQPLAVPQDISIQLLSRRPDLMAQLWQVDALAREVGAAKAEYWPDINLTGFAGFQSGSWSNLFDWVSRAFSLFPAMRLPIYTAGAIGANEGAKKALFDEAIYRYNDLILKSFQEVADLLAIGKSIYGQKGQQARIVTNASERYRLTQLRQQRGLDNGLDLYRFLDEQLQAQLEDLQLLYGQYLVSIKLIKALGGGYL